MKKIITTLLLITGLYAEKCTYMEGLSKDIVLQCPDDTLVYVNTKMIHKVVIFRKDDITRIYIGSTNYDIKFEAVQTSQIMLKISQ